MRWATLTTLTGSQRREREENQSDPFQRCCPSRGKNEPVERIWNTKLQYNGYRSLSMC